MHLDRFRKANGWKIGYMEDLWEEKGYAKLNLTRQNLSDQARKLEETMGDIGETILSAHPRCKNL